MGVLFLPGTHVCSNCIINPGVVVSGKIPENTRLQMSPAAFTRLDQSKLQLFARRSAGHNHQAILKGFLQSLGSAWHEDAGGTTFRLGDGTEFRSFAEGNRIELWRNVVKIASYDLETFHTDPSRDRLHRTFVAYIRRRFGLTLRVRY